MYFYLIKFQLEVIKEEKRNYLYIKLQTGSGGVYTE